ncbi:MAG: hypothetical protein E4H25_04420 [Methanomassiliicoccus sp.]|nr:MAG: hypothetical protein E4H25_04420 [Methanomassiliicoccus sp.]
MIRTTANKKGRIFTAELKSKRALKSVSLDNGTQNGILIEGTLGTLIGARFQDGIVLAVNGTREYCAWTSRLKRSRECLTGRKSQEERRASRTEVDVNEDDCSPC